MVSIECSFLFSKIRTWLIQHFPKRVFIGSISGSLHTERKIWVPQRVMNHLKAFFLEEIYPGEGKPVEQPMKRSRCFQCFQAQWKINMEAFQQALVQAPKLLAHQVTVSNRQKIPQGVGIKLYKSIFWEPAKGE